MRWRSLATEPFPWPFLRLHTHTETCVPNILRFIIEFTCIFREKNIGCALSRVRFIYKIYTSAMCVSVGREYDHSPRGGSNGCWRVEYNLAYNKS